MLVSVTPIFMNKILFALSFLLTSICNAQVPTITITEINYHSDSTMNSGNWFEMYNTGASSVDLSLFRIRDSSATNLYLIQPGVSIPAGGYLVFCSDTLQFDAIYNITNRIGNLGFSFGNGSDGIRIFDNTNTLVLEMFYTDSLPWPMGADGYGRTMQIKNNLLNPADTNSWTTGCVLGSPGTDYVPCINETIVVSEINYQSAPAQNAGDWFEIRNIGSTSIDITNYGVRNHKLSMHYLIPSGTVLAPQGSVVVYNTPALFLTQFPGVFNRVGPFLFGLDADGDAIRLYNSNDKVIFSVYYNDDPPWVNEPDGFGYTLESDTNFSFSRQVDESISWFAGCPEGSPGNKYNPDCSIGIEEEISIELSMYPNPASEFIQIDFQVIPEVWKLKIYNALGQQIMNFMNKSIIKVDNLMNGTYILELETSTFITRKKILIAHE